jgi:hypothetical protein
MLLDFGGIKSTWQISEGAMRVDVPEQYEPP